MVSGTRSASVMRAPTGTSGRFSRGTATACLTCTMPTTSSASSSMTGNRLNPVFRARARTASADSDTRMVDRRGRGVMTSPASSSENEMVRSRSVAVSCSREPSDAERRSSDVSSSALRAPESSSCGSMPIARRTAFAVPLRTATAGLNTVVNAICSGTTIFAVCSGSASAKFFGTSSPRIIESSVAMTSATIDPTVSTTASGSCIARKGASSSVAIDGSSR